MFGIFRKKQTYDLQWLAVDMHSHLIPSIDDGCKDAAMSIQCMRGLQELGLNTFFATPHIYAEMYPNTAEIIHHAHQTLQHAMQNDPNMRQVAVSAAAEYMIDDHFQQEYTDKIPLTLPGNQLLVEMSYQYERQDLYEHLFQLQLRGFKPILAHPERYTYYHDKLPTYKEIKDRGCLLQVNLLSLGGYYGEKVRKVAHYLVKEGMIDYVGTDLHHHKHLRAITEYVRGHDLQKLLKNNPIKNQELIA